MIIVYQQKESVRSVLRLQILTNNNIRSVFLQHSQEFFLPWRLLFKIMVAKNVTAQLHALTRIIFQNSQSYTCINIFVSEDMYLID